MPVDIAFITVNYNTLDWVKHLAEFFSSLDVPFTFTFTVVDNHSTDGSQEFLESHPDVEYLQTGENLGYGRGMNGGVGGTSSKYVCVMNTDLILNRDALVKLWHFLEERPDAGLCAPRISYGDGRDQGKVFKTSLFAFYANWFAKLLASQEKRRIARATAPVKVDGVMGAFFLIRRSVIPSPALFDKDFFLFYEDTALAHTLKNSGVGCYIIPAANIMHLGGKSGSANSVSAFYQNRYLYLNKFYGPFHAKAVNFLDRVRILRKWMVYSLFSRLTSSPRMKEKKHHYEMAWEAARQN
ncbi:MAG TPA: glycosyltransferase family 2 protein [Candidatus Limnocylindrales bacterium]|nr:glycosyltransferase family 2 protein [Candidatus Limnocylindrales bacterium]